MRLLLAIDRPFPLAKHACTFCHRFVGWRGCRSGPDRRSPRR